MHAVLGVSDHCIATYPGDFAQALMALDATVSIVGAGQKAGSSVRGAASAAGRDARRRDCAAPRAN
jgi:CO/xanthine dehydrogenase FAD-binding subunit